MNPIAQKRLATMERQLQGYVVRTLPLATSAAQERRRVSYRRRVIHENLRRQRALRLRGTEVGWRDVTLTQEDSDRAARLL